MGICDLNDWFMTRPDFRESVGSGDSRLTVRSSNRQELPHSCPRQWSGFKSSGLTQDSDEPRNNRPPVELQNCSRWRPVHSGGVDAADAFASPLKHVKAVFGQLTTGKISPPSASADGQRRAGEFTPPRQSLAVPVGKKLTPLKCPVVPTESQLIPVACGTLFSGFRRDSLALLCPGPEKARPSSGRSCAGEALVSPAPARKQGEGQSSLCRLAGFHRRRPWNSTTKRLLRLSPVPPEFWGTPV